MGMTHRFDFKPKVTLPTVCTSCKEDIQAKENVALVNGKVFCYHCTNIASYQDYAFYRAKEKVAIKQFFDILFSLIFGLALIALAILLDQGNAIVAFVPRFLHPYDLLAYVILGTIILMLPFFGFIHRATKYGFPTFFEAMMRFPKVSIYPDEEELPKYRPQKKEKVSAFILSLLLVGFLLAWSPILMVIRLVQYLNYGAKINRIDDQYLREHKGEKKTKDYHLYVKHADDEQKAFIDKVKTKFGKYPVSAEGQGHPDYHEVRRGMRLFVAYRLRYKLEKELFKKYPKAPLIFVISKH